MKTKLLQLIVLLILFVSFSVSAQVPTRVGWWKFDTPSYLVKAEIGSDLEIVGTQESVTGPVEGNGATNIGIGSYLIMNHEMYGNGGGSLVNEYTLQIDFSVPEIGIWHAFFQTDPANSDDGDLFTRSGSNAIGTQATGYSSKGISADTWYRMIITVKNGEFFKIYMNGELWLDAAIQPIDGRFALAESLLMFADNDEEDNIINCSEIGIWDIALDEYQVNQLGDAAGDRARVRTKMGWWKFDDASDLLKAEVGIPLVLVGTQESVNGPSTDNKATRIGVESYLKMAHEIALNGEDTLVNEYSIQMDFSVPETETWHSFFQTDTSNNSDAELFTKNSNNSIGNATTGYTTNSIVANTWYRMVISVKNGSFFRIYINGYLWLDAVGQAKEERFGLDDIVLIFADNDGEDGTIICSELSIWEVALTDNEVEALGGDPVVTIPSRVGWWKFDDSSDLLKAEVGSALELTGVQVPDSGPVAGNDATIISSGSYLKMSHGIYGNGDGIMVNNYSIQIDFNLPEIGVWHAFIQTSSENADDADLFTNSSANAIGTGTTGYSANAVSAGVWYRMILSVKNGVFFKVYIDGEQWLESAGQTIDGRFALSDILLMFADDDGDDGTIYCSELGIWDIALNADQVAKLGDATTVSTTSVLKQKIGNTSDLDQNYPNPFSFSTIFPYQIHNTGIVNFRILDIAGNEVQAINQGVKTPGNYSLELYSDKLPNGIYYIQMTTNQQTSVRKMMVIK